LIGARSNDKAKYDTIILVGYSKGALLIRKAFVYGHGRIEDLETESGELRDPVPWVALVERFVLLAGMNRGWTLRYRPKEMRRSRFWLSKIFIQFCRLTGIGALLRQSERGEPFVANLRIQWLTVMRSLPVDRRPTVIQFLGDKDDLVSSEDQRDVTVARDFIWVRVNNTGHADIINLEDRVLGEERRRKIRKALGDDREIESLRRLSSKLPDNVDPLVHEVVFVLHGIRDMAAWTSQFEGPLQVAYYSKTPKQNSKIYITWPSYGYFGMGPFLLWADRQTNVRWFMDEFTEIKARFPNLQKVHFIGHSNGTYVLGSALQKYKTLQVDNIAFAGCVLRRDFEWDNVTAQFKNIRNYVASGDWVVALFPRLFEIPLFTLVNKDIGSAGFNGFTGSRGNALETKFLIGGHSAALTHANTKSIVEFVLNGKKLDVPELIGGGPTWRMEYSSKFCWLIWLLIVGVVAALFVGWLTLIAHFLPGSLQPFQLSLAIATFVVLVVALLRSI
jgi:hypothetical protein